MKHFGAKLNQNDDFLGQRADDIKPTLWRYVILFLFCINSANKAFQWIQIPASTFKFTYFYGVDNFVINATSVLFMLAFVVLSLPACYIIERIGLRKAVLIGSFGTAVGSIMKCFSCYEDGIYSLFIGQTLVSLSEQFIFSIPSRLASVWFPDHQVSSAVSICLLGNQLGVALGFVIPEFILDSAETKDEIGQGFYVIFLGMAVVSVVSFLADVVLFDEAPKFAPGTARLNQIKQEQEVVESERGFLGEMSSLINQITQLLRNKDLTLLALSFGINIGVNYSLATILNQMLEPIWPGDDMLIGKTGFIIIISGALGLPFWGRLLDMMHRYLQINVLLTVGTILSLVAFGIVISGFHSVLSIYLTAALIGFFQTGMMVASLEFAVELTYPAPELVSSSVMNVMPQIFGTVFVFSASYIVDTYGAITTNCFYLICLLTALLMLTNINEVLKRQDAVVGKNDKDISSVEIN